MTKKLFCALLLALSVFLCACNAESDPVVNSTAPENQAASAPVEIVSFENIEFVAASTSWEDNEARITIRNTSSKVLSDITLYVDYLDEEDKILETGFASCYTLIDPDQAAILTHDFFKYVPYAIRITGGSYRTNSEEQDLFYFSSPYYFICDFGNEESESSQESSFEETACNHDWQEIVTVYGVQAYMCSKCSFTYSNLNDWEPLSSLKLLSCSNNGNVEVGEFVAVGDWTDTSGVEFPESIKFHVSRDDSKNGRAYTKYYLNGQYFEMSGCVVVSNLSDSDASMFIRIHLDDKQVYECEAISSEEYYTFAFEVLGVDTVLIECITRDSADAHCIVAASVHP